MEYLRSFLKANQFTPNDIQLLEGDINTYTPEKKFGFVFSVGLVEHFENTKDIIQKHLRFCEKGGTLLIILPNFTGINGWMNKTFDIENYNVHNIKSMDPELLRSIAKELNLSNIHISYFGKFSVWLENYATLKWYQKLFFKWCWIWGKIFTKIIPIESKFLSPYIALEATNPQEG